MFYPDALVQRVRLMKMSPKLGEGPLRVNAVLGRDVFDRVRRRHRVKTQLQNYCSPEGRFIEAVALIDKINRAHGDRPVAR